MKAGLTEKELLSYERLYDRPVHHAYEKDVNNGSGTDRIC